MVTYFVEQPYVDMLDSARATLANSINDTSLFAESQIAREALVVTATVGDYIRGSLVVLPEIPEVLLPEDVEQTDPDDAPTVEPVIPEPEEEEEEDEHTPPPDSTWDGSSEGQGGG